MLFGPTVTKEAILEALGVYSVDINGLKENKAKEEVVEFLCYRYVHFLASGPSPLRSDVHRQLSNEQGAFNDGKH